MFYRPYSIIILFLLTSFGVAAQTDAHEIVFNGQVGLKIFGFIGVANNNVFPNTRLRNKPVWHGTVDYGLNKRASIGLAYGVHIADQVFDSGQSVNDVVARAVRVDVGCRLLFHYESHDDLDLYSGIRAGYKTDDITPVDASGSSNVFFTGDRVTIGLVLFGMRYWVHDKFAMTMEVHLGRPYIANIGIASRLY